MKLIKIHFFLCLPTHLYMYVCIYGTVLHCIHCFQQDAHQTIHRWPVFLYRQITQHFAFSCSSMHCLVLYYCTVWFFFFPNTRYNIITWTGVAHENWFVSIPWSRFSPTFQRKGQVQPYQHHKHQLILSALIVFHAV